MSLFEFIRFSILVLGWPFLIIGSIFIFAKQIKFNKKLNQPSFGKLIFAVILGWFATMYSLGITATIFMFQNLNAGVKTVLPIFLIWIITMLILISIIKKWNKEVLITQKFYNQLTDGVKNIINGSLSYRIKTSELNGEAEKNSEAFNEMIKELEKKEDWIVETAKREKEINIMKSEFISIAAHQLRTPLSAIKWIFSILLDEDAGKINQEQKELLERGGISTKRMIELVNDLLDVSRIESKVAENNNSFGYVIFLTNDHSYLREPRKTSLTYNYRTTDGRKVTKCSLGLLKGYNKGRERNVKIKNSYEIKWKNYGNHNFKFLFLGIKK